MFKKPKRILAVFALLLLLTTSVFGAYEDFTTYTEVDSASDITVTSNKLDISSMRRDAISSVYKDFGVDYFGNFKHELEILVSDIFSSWPTVMMWHMTDIAAATSQDMSDANNGLSVTFHQPSPGFGVTILLDNRFISSQDASSVVSLDTPYYLIIERTSTALTCEIYTDEARTNLWETLTVTYSSDTMRYLGGAGSRDSTGGADDYLSGYIQNLDIGEPFIPPDTSFDSQAFTNPGSTLTDFSFMMDLSLQSDNWWLEADDVSGTRGRASKEDGTELAVDWIDYDDATETGWARVLWSGDAESTGTQVVRLWPPDEGNSEYAASDPYGSDNAYNSDWWAYYPAGGGNDRTVNARHLSAQGSVVAGDSVGKVGAATEYNGSNESYYRESITPPGTTFTYMSWFNPDNVTVNEVLINIGNFSASSDYYQLVARGGDDGDPIQATQRRSASVGPNTTTSFSASTWQWASATHVLDVANVWLNNTGNASLSSIGIPVNIDNVEIGALGRSNIHSQADRFAGKINESQVHAVELSADWRTEEYAQTDDNATFWGERTWSEVIRYVDPDSAVGGDGTTWELAYDSLFDWEAAEETDLVSDGISHHVYVRSSAGTADTTALTIGGWITGTDNYILVEAAEGDRAIKTGWDTSRYRLEITDAGAITITDNHVRIDGLQVRTIYVSSGGTGIGGFSISADNDLRISNCRIRGDTDLAANDTGISYQDTDVNIKIWNTIVEDWDSRGILLNVNTAVIYNTIVTNTASSGIELDGGVIDIKNIAVFNTTNDFRIDGGTITISYSASDDGDGTNAIAPSGGSWLNEFVDPANGDFTQLGTGNTYRAGTDPDPSLYTTDMDGQEYFDPTYSVGVDENKVAAYGDYTSAIWTNPDSALTDFSGMIDLSNVHYLWWDEVTSSDGTQGRIATSDGIELAADWIDFDSGAETGWVRFLWPDLDDVDTQTVYVYPPLTGNVSYEPDDVYGAYGAYDSGWEGYYPVFGDTGSTLTDRTSHGEDGTLNAGVSFANDKILFDPTNSAVTLMASKPLDGGTAFTIIAEVNADDLSADRGIFYTDAHAGSEPLLLWLDAAGTDHYGALVTATQTTTTKLSNAVPSVNTDYHVVLSREAFASIRLYIDGVEDTAGDFPIVGINGPLGASGAASYYLGNASGLNKDFDGEIWNFQVHSLQRDSDWITEERSMTFDNLTFWGVWSWSGVAVEVIRYVDTDAVTGFTDWTETDPNSDLTVTTNNIIVDSLQALSDTGVWKDYGAGTFGDVVHEVDFNFSSVDTSALVGVWVLHNETTLQGYSEDNGIWLFVWGGGSGAITLYLEDLDNNDYESSVELFVDTDYYVTITRSGNSTSCVIYSDPERLTIVDTISITTTTGNYRTLQTASAGYIGTAEMSITISNFYDGLSDGTTWELAYDSLFDWEAAEETDLMLANEWHHVYVRASAGTADTTAVAIDGWDTGVDWYILIEAADGDQAVKTNYDTSRYRITGTNTDLLTISENYVRVEGLQFGLTVTNTTSRCIYITNVGASDIRVSNSRFEGVSINGTQGARAIDLNDTDAIVTVWNSIADGFISGDNPSDSSYIAYLLSVGDRFTLYNTIAINSFSGFRRLQAPMIVINSASFNNTDDFTGSFSAIEYAASDDGDGTNAVAPSGGNWDNEFADPAGGDFTLLNTGNLFEAGADNPSSGLYITDMEGDAYNVGGYSIGVDEFTGEPPEGITQIILPEAGIHSVITGGKIIHALLIIQNIMSNLVLVYVFWQLQKRKNELLFYESKENIKALADIERYLEGGN